MIHDHAKNHPPLTGRKGGPIAEPSEVDPDGMSYFVPYAVIKIMQNADIGKEGLYE